MASGVLCRHVLLWRGHSIDTHARTMKTEDMMVVCGLGLLYVFLWTLGHSGVIRRLPLRLEAHGATIGLNAEWGMCRGEKKGMYC